MWDCSRMETSSRTQISSRLSPLLIWARRVSVPRSSSTKLITTCRRPCWRTRRRRPCFRPSAARRSSREVPGRNPRRPSTGRGPATWTIGPSPLEEWRPWRPRDIARCRPPDGHGVRRRAGHGAADDRQLRPANRRENLLQHRAQIQCEGSPVGGGSTGGGSTVQDWLSVRVSTSTGVVPPFVAGVSTVRVRSCACVCVPAARADRAPVAVHGPTCSRRRPWVSAGAGAAVRRP